MFDDTSFAIFELPGLEERMAAIRSEIQPIFQTLAEAFQLQLETELGNEYFIHIAQHRRRTVYPPDSTLVALSRNKRGYKMEPHFQLGISPDFVFIWLACIDQPKNKQQQAQLLLDHRELLQEIPTDFYLSGDHTQNKIEPFSVSAAEKMLVRFRDIKKGEFQIGRIIEKNSPLWKTPKAAQNYMAETYQQVLPIYQLFVTATKQ